MSSHDYGEIYKIVVVGDPAVGKTNLLATFLAIEDDKVGLAVDGSTSSNTGTAKGFSSVHKPTISVDFGTKIVQHPNGKRIKVHLWDTASAERFRSTTTSAYRHAAGAIVVYDVTNQSSFENAQNVWLKDLRAAPEPANTLANCIMLVGNKTDQEATATGVVTAAAQSHTAKQLHLMDQRTCAKTGKNVQSMFEELIISIYDQDKGNNSIVKNPPESQLMADTPCCVALEPKDALVFVLKPQSSPTATLTIRNVLLSEGIAFTILATKPTRYTVRPPNGWLAPNTTTTVTIVLQQSDCEQLRQNKAAVAAPDKFLIQTTLAKDATASTTHQQAISFKLTAQFQFPLEPHGSSNTLLPPLAPPAAKTPSSPHRRSRSASKDGSARRVIQLQSERHGDEERRAKLLAHRDGDKLNLKCFNCAETDSATQAPPVYICLDFGIFVCDMCSSTHRQSEHRVKSISMSKFTDHEVDFILKSGGNAAAHLKWRKTYTNTFKIPGVSAEERSQNAVWLTFVEHAWTGEKPQSSIPAIPPTTGQSPSVSPTRPQSSGPSRSTNVNASGPTRASTPSTTPASSPTKDAPPTLWDKLTPSISKMWPWLNGLKVNPHWSGDTVTDGSSSLAGLETQFRDKLVFVRTSLGIQGEPTGGPFGGINLLRGLAPDSSDSSSGLLEADLFYAIEVLDLRKTGAYEALDKLESYCATLRKHNASAHPLLLLALARCATKTGSPSTASVPRSLYQCFKAMYPDASQKWMAANEKALLTSPSPSVPGTAQPTAVSTSTGVRREWEQFQQSTGCYSDAMEELLSMVGLERVKRSALQLFKSAFAIQQMSQEMQQKNRSMALNYCFTGNPGTGKTTIAKLFARILVDSKMRRNAHIELCSAQQLKDDGPQAFRTKIQQALGGVLFIDEAYELEPQVDPRGKPIVAELLTAAEDLRHDLSVILAGYEDDIQNKLYAYNTGLRSRFIEVPFDDFDQNDLLFVWNKLVTERGWLCDSPSVGIIACRRLAKAAGRKGFGNARAVRQAFETAIQAAMARPSFVGATPTIQLIDIVGEKPTKNPKLANVLKEINDKIGWTRIKQRVHELVDLCDTNYERELTAVTSGGAMSAPATTIPVMLHRLFLGNPGTGKTTFASYYGRVLKHLHLLSNGDVVKKTAGDFVGAAVGQSQSKTNEILEHAKGKVLIIDEAYNLNDSLYGKQVLDVLVEKIQGSESDDIAVILIGYEQQMTEMMRVQNPGLARRFPVEFAFMFDDYSDRELLEIFAAACAKQHVQSSLEVDEAVVTYLAKQKRVANFGNAGAVEQLLKNAMANATARHRCQPPSQSKASQYIQLAVDDILSETARRSGAGGDGGDPLSLLDGLYRMDSIRKELGRLQKRLQVAQAQGEAQPSVGHFVFRGSPGTGKTTVARVMGKILFGMGVLTSAKVLETSGLSMTGEYVGATKKKVETQLEEARGAILFIDEAYEMGKGAYGEEALTTLVAAMTNPVYKGTVVIIAGYPHDLDVMLGRNAGLKSRFTRFFDFNDWELDDCLAYIQARATKQGYTVDVSAQLVLHDMFQRLRTMPGFGNGRDVEYVWSCLLECQSERVYDQRELGENGDDDGRTVLASDAKEASEIVLKARAPPPQAVAPMGAQFFPGTGMLPFGYDAMAAMGFPQQFQQQQFQQQQFQQQQSRQQEPAVIMEETRAAQDVQQKVLEVTQVDDTGTGSGSIGQVQYVRDEGVSEQDWRVLEAAKEVYNELMKTMLDEQASRLEREEAARKLKEYQAQQERLRQLMNCPAGFQWFQCGSGWRCGGGSHFVSNTELEQKFMT